MSTYKTKNKPKAPPRQWTPFILIQSRLLYRDGIGRRFIVSPDRDVACIYGLEVEHRVLTMHIDTREYARDYKDTDNPINEFDGAIMLRGASGKKIQIPFDADYTEVMKLCLGEQRLNKESCITTAEVSPYGGSGLVPESIKGWHNTQSHRPYMVDDFTDIFFGMSNVLQCRGSMHFWSQVRKIVAGKKAGSSRPGGVEYTYQKDEDTREVIDLPDLKFLTLADHSIQPGTAWAVPGVENVLLKLKAYPQVRCRQRGYLWTGDDADPRWHDSLAESTRQDINSNNLLSPEGCLLKMEAASLLLPVWEWIGTKNMMDLDLVGVQRARNLFQSE